MESKTIFMSGAAGFVGSNLVRRLLKDGHEIHVSIRKDSKLWRIEEIIKELNIHYSDIINYNNIEKTIIDIKPEIVYNLAIYGGYPFQIDSNKMFETNLIGTMNVLNACMKVDIQCFINTGTSSEYGLKEAPIKETDFLEPVSYYAFSKAAATIYCHMIAKTQKVPIVMIRPFSVYGYYEEPTRLIPYLIKSYLKGDKPKLSSKDTLRDFVFIEDLIEAYILAANKPSAFGEIINIGYGKQHTIGQVVEKIRNMTGSNIDPLWGAVEKRINEPKMWVADITKAKKILGWRPKYNLDEGLNKTIAWLNSNLDFY